MITPEALGRLAFNRISDLVVGREAAIAESGGYDLYIDDLKLVAEFLLSRLQEGHDNKSFFDESSKLYSRGGRFIGTFQEFLRLGLSEEDAQERTDYIIKEFPNHAKDLGLEIGVEEEEEKDKTA